MYANKSSLKVTEQLSDILMLTSKLNRWIRMGKLEVGFLTNTFFKIVLLNSIYIYFLKCSYVLKYLIY